MSFSFSQHQKECISKVIKNKNVFIVAGYAGTGKTKIITEIANEMAIAGLRVLVTCFTGKAAQRLRESFDYVHSRVTVKNYHQVIYTIVDANGEEPVFGYKKDWNVDFDVVLVDESSMIDRETFEDIKKSNLPITFFGDPFQLPPVSSKTTLFDNPDILLTEVFRQRGDSYILDIATDLRQGIDRLMDMPSISPSDIFSKVDELQDECPVLFMTNKDRVYFNREYRKYCFDDTDLQKNDLLICLKNNHRLEIYNGQTVRVKKVLDKVEVNDVIFYIANVDVNGDRQLVCFPKGQLHGDGIFVIQKEEVESLGEMYPNITQNNIMLFDYAYGITCHKAQGSQFEEVVVKVPMWMKRKDPVYFNRWMYTAMTRAKSHCHFF